ncbi:MAG: hypothetical protein IH865_01595 [Chloroflexi bacterium]|nr:hypothetical protein [Chloroflexota bacterium]
MAKSKNGATEPGNSVNPKNEADAKTKTAGQGSATKPKEPAQQVPRNGKSRQGKGGGPKTAAGKVAVSRNAIKHGITSPSPVIPGMETEEAWQAHLDGIIESVAPEGYLERELAELLALHLWQFRRVNRYITAVTAMHVASMEEDFINSAMYLYGVEAVYEQADGKRNDLPDPTQEEMQLRRERRMIPGKIDLDTVMRYQGHLQRLWQGTLHELEALQARRLGQASPLARIDHNASPAYRNTSRPQISDVLPNSA